MLLLRSRIRLLAGHWWPESSHVEAALHKSLTGSGGYLHIATADRAWCNPSRLIGVRDFAWPVTDFAAAPTMSRGTSGNWDRVD